MDTNTSDTSRGHVEVLPTGEGDGCQHHHAVNPATAISGGGNKKFFEAQLVSELNQDWGMAEYKVTRKIAQ